MSGSDVGTICSYAMSGTDIGNAATSRTKVDILALIWSMTGSPTHPLCDVRYGHRLCSSQNSTARNIVLCTRYVLRGPDLGFAATTRPGCEGRVHVQEEN
eukprot:1461901-Rhodomonas_salina.3